MQTSPHSLRILGSLTLVAALTGAAFAARQRFTQDVDLPSVDDEGNPDCLINPGSGEAKVVSNTRNDIVRVRVKGIVDNDSGLWQLYIDHPDVEECLENEILGLDVQLSSYLVTFRGRARGTARGEFLGP